MMDALGMLAELVAIPSVTDTPGEAQAIAWLERLLQALRDVLNGKTKEPGDKTIDEILSLKDPQSARARRDAVATEPPPEDAAPAAVETTNP